VALAVVLVGEAVPAAAVVDLLLLVAVAGLDLLVAEVAAAGVVDSLSLLLLA